MDEALDNTAMPARPAAAPTVAVLGSLNMDTVLQVAHFPGPGETLLASAVARHPGGKGLNQAVAAARAEGQVRLAGAVGDDVDGRALRAMLAAEGIGTDTVRVVTTAPTGVAHILVVPGGENQIVVATGANAAARAPASTDAAVFLAQLEVPLETVRDFFAARPPGAIGILNAAPYHPGARALFALADVVVVNATELAGYAGEATPPESPDTAAAMARGLIEGATRHIVVTLGSLGALIAGAHETNWCPGLAATAIDTTGAGDCFCGYLAAALAAGQPLAAAVGWANRAASIAVARVGAATSIPFAHEVHALTQA